MQSFMTCLGHDVTRDVESKGWQDRPRGYTWKRLGGTREGVGNNPPCVMLLRSFGLVFKCSFSNAEKWELLFRLLCIHELYSSSLFHPTSPHPLNTLPCIPRVSELPVECQTEAQAIHTGKGLLLGPDCVQP